MRSLGVPSRPNRCLYLPIGYKPFKTCYQILLAMTLISLNEQTTGLGILNTLLVPTRGLTH